MVSKAGTVVTHSSYILEETMNPLESKAWERILSLQSPAHDRG